MDVPSLAGKEITISAVEPKVIFAASTIVQSAPIIRTVETMSASMSMVGADGKGEKISMIPTRTKDGRYGLHVDIVNTSQGKSSVQKVDVTLNAREWVQIIGKSRKRVVTIRVVPIFE